MRVLVFLSSLNTGGAEFSTLTFYGWLKKQGVEIRLVCFKQATTSFNIKQFELDEVHYLKGNSFWPKLVDFMRITKAFKPQIVHSILFEANILARFSRMYQHSFLHLESLVNEMYSSNRLNDPQVTRLKLQGYKIFDFCTQYFGVDHFHANGETVAKHYIKQLLIDPKRITIIARGRANNMYLNDQANRAQIRAQLNTGERLLFINVARHEFQKGLDIIVEAISKIDNAKQHLQLILVGREGKLTASIKAKIESHGLENCVILLGHRTDVNRLLSSADVFVFPSRFEGLPGAIIEAEAAGLPIVCSDIPSHHEVAKEGANAIFFPVDDVDALRAAMTTILHDHQKRKEMSVHSLAIFNDRYLIDQIHTKMKIMLEALITQPIP